MNTFGRTRAAYINRQRARARIAEKVADSYEEHEVTRVSRGREGSVTSFGPLGIFLPHARQIRIRRGDRVRLYPKDNFGGVVRGADLLPKYRRGKIVELYYRTEEMEAELRRREREQDAARKARDYEATRASYDRRVTKLVEPFRIRIETFRTRRGDAWRYEFEPYELFCLEQAQVFADYARTAGEAQLMSDIRAGKYGDKTEHDPSIPLLLQEHLLHYQLDWLRQFREWPVEEQQRVVPEMSSDHSGNTFGFAVHMANLLLQYAGEHPDYVVNTHGSICPLVGCQAFGCFASTQPQGESYES